MTAYSFNTWNHSTHWGLAPTLPAQVVAAAHAGYDHVGLDVPSLMVHEAAGLPFGALRDSLDEASITCFEIAALVVSDDWNATAASLDVVRRAVRAFGARSVLAVVHGTVDEPVVRHTRRCVDALADDGVHVAVEFLPVLPVNSIQAVCQLIDEVDRPELGVMVDSWHFFAGPSTWDALARLPVERLGFVQLSDAAPPSSDDVADEYRHHRVLPGEGHHDLAAFAAAVGGRFGPVTVSVEVLSAPWRDRPLETFAAATLAASRSVWDGPAQRAVTTGLVPLPPPPSTSSTAHELRPGGPMLRGTHTSAWRRPW